MLDRPNEQVYAYTRTYKQQTFLFTASFVDKQIVWEIPDERFQTPGASLLQSNYEKVEELGKVMTVRPYEARLYLLE